MNDFMSVNSGIRSRFPIVINFPDYSNQELAQIAEIIIKSKGYRFKVQKKFLLFSNEILKKSISFFFFRKKKKGETKQLVKLFSEMKKKGLDNGNGRMVRNVVEQAIRNIVKRFPTQAHIENATKEELLTLTIEDFE